MLNLVFVARRCCHHQYIKSHTTQSLNIGSLFDACALIYHSYRSRRQLRGLQYCFYWREGWEKCQVHPVSVCQMSKIQIPQHTLLGEANNIISESVVLQCLRQI